MKFFHRAKLWVPHGGSKVLQQQVCLNRKFVSNFDIWMLLTMTNASFPSLDWIFERPAANGWAGSQWIARGRLSYYCFKRQEKVPDENQAYKRVNAATESHLDVLFNA